MKKLNQNPTKNFFFFGFVFSGGLLTLMEESSLISSWG